jgi:hypothetical protein
MVLYYQTEPFTVLQCSDRIYGVQQLSINNIFWFCIIRQNPLWFWSVLTEPMGFSSFQWMTFYGSVLPDRTLRGSGSLRCKPFKVQYFFHRTFYSSEYLYGTIFGSELSVGTFKSFVFSFRTIKWFCNTCRTII